MKSLINVNFCGAVYIDKSNFNENWLFEPELSNSRGMLMYLQQIYGMLLLKPGMALTKHYGLHTDFLMYQLELKGQVGGLKTYLKHYGSPS